jgi:hypothetical protein
VLFYMYFETDCPAQNIISGEHHLQDCEMAARKPRGVPNTPVGIASTVVDNLPADPCISVGGIRPPTPTPLRMARWTLHISRDEA